MKEHLRQKTPGTSRRSLGVTASNYGFEQEDSGMYRVICNSEITESISVGAERRVPPFVFDQQAKRYNASGINVPVARSWRTGRSTDGLELSRRG